MIQPRKYKKKELLEIFRTRNDNALLALIDSLWREYPAQWKEQKLSLADVDKTDDTHADYDPRYVYARNDFRNADNSQTTSYATAHGFGHKARADFAQVFGFFNYALSFFQTTMGPFAEIPENQTPDAWVNTDLLYVLGNGKDEANRSNALEIFKSGLVHWHNAQVIGAYNHGNEGEPAPDLIPGLIQYTAENGFECVKEDLQWHPFGESAYEIAVRNGFVGTEIEWLESLKGDDGAPGSDGSPGEDGKSAYQIAVDNGFVGTEAEWLASLQGDDGDPAPDTYIELTDTPASYPATNKGQLAKQSGASSMGFAAQIGEDDSGPWLKKTKSTTSTALSSYTKAGEEGKFWATTIGDKLRFEGSATSVDDPGYNVDVYVDGVKVKTIKSDGSTFYIYHQATAAETHIYYDYTGEPGTVNYSYALYLVEVISESGGLQLLGDGETIGLLNWYRNDLTKKIIDIAGLLKMNLTDEHIEINGIRYPTSIPPTTKFLVIRPDGKIETVDIVEETPYPGEGIPVSNGDGWGTSIAGDDNIIIFHNGTSWQTAKAYTANDVRQVLAHDNVNGIMWRHADFQPTSWGLSHNRPAGATLGIVIGHDTGILLSSFVFEIIADANRNEGLHILSENSLGLQCETNEATSYSASFLGGKGIFATELHAGNGLTGTFKTADGKTITVTAGVLVSYTSNGNVYIIEAPQDGKTYGRKNGAWVEIDTGGGVPGTETLSGTSVTVNWNGKTSASLTLTGATTIAFGTPANYVKRLFVTGDYSLTLPSSAEVLSGEYDGTKVNIIDLIPSPSGTVYVTIN